MPSTFIAEQLPTSVVRPSLTTAGRLFTVISLKIESIVRHSLQFLDFEMWNTCLVYSYEEN